MDVPKTGVPLETPKLVPKDNQCQHPATRGVLASVVNFPFHNNCNEGE